MKVEDIEQLVQEIWNKSFHVDQNDRTQSLFDIKPRSIDAMKFVGQLEAVFGQQIDLEFLVNHQSIREISFALSTASSSNRC